MYTRFGVIKTKASWKEVGHKLQELPGIILAVTDEQENIAGLVDSTMARPIIELPGTISEKPEWLISPVIAVPELSVTTAIRDMIDAREARWYVVREGMKLLGIASPHAIYSAYTEAISRFAPAIGEFGIASIDAGVPFRQGPPTYKCQGNPVHTYTMLPGKRNKYRRPICPTDDTELVLVK
jgi:CBS domain-containing protein